MKSLVSAIKEQASLNKSLSSISRRAAVIGEIFGESRRANFLVATESARRAGLNTVYLVDSGSGASWTHRPPGGIDSLYCLSFFSF